MEPATGRVPITRQDLSEDIPIVWSNQFYADNNMETARVQLAQLYHNMDILMQSQGAAMKDVAHILQWSTQEIKETTGDFHKVRIELYWPDPKDCPTPSGFVLYDQITNNPRIQRCIEFLGILPGPIRKKPTMVKDRGVGNYYALYNKVGPLWFNAGEIPGEKSTRKAYLEFSELPDAGRFMAHGRMHPSVTMVQAWFLYQTLFKRLLRDAGLDMSRVVMQQIYMRDLSEYPSVERIANLTFDGKIPATSVIAVDNLTALPDRTGMIEIEFTCDVS